MEWKICKAKEQPKCGRTSNTSAVSVCVSGSFVDDENVSFTYIRTTENWKRWSRVHGVPIMYQTYLYFFFCKGDKAEERKNVAENSSFLQRTPFERNILVAADLRAQSFPFSHTFYGSPYSFTCPRILPSWHRLNFRFLAARDILFFSSILASVFEWVLFILILLWLCCVIIIIN